MVEVQQHLWLKSVILRYCKFGNFRENFIFAKSAKRHICQLKKTRLWHDLPTSFKNKEFSPFRKVFFAKLRIRENKTLAKVSEFTVQKIRFEFRTILKFLVIRSFHEV